MSKNISKQALAHKKEMNAHSHLISNIVFEALLNFEAGVIIVDKKKHVLFINDWVMEKSDLTTDLVLKKPLCDVFPELETGRILMAIENCLKSNLTKRISNKLLDYPFPLYEMNFKKGKKEIIDQQILIKPVTIAGNHTHCIIVISDVTRTLSREYYLKRQALDLQQAVREVKKREEKIKAVFDNTTDAIVIFNKIGEIENINAACSEIFQISFQKGTPCHIGDIIFDFEHKKDISAFLEDKEIPIGGVSELTGKRFNLKFPVEFSLGSIKDSDGDKYVAIVRDITKRKRIENKLIKLAQYDDLTGLCNRSMFLEKLNDILQRAIRKKRMFALLFLDLDHFKTINDTLGHDFGDELLKWVARELKHLLRTSDVIARLGGDEFVVILDELTDMDRAAIVAQKIIRTIAKKIRLKGESIRVSTSIGIAIYPQDGDDEKTLVKNADMAMYSAKESGRNGYAYYSADMNAKAHSRIQLEKDLRYAIANNELVLFFQPQISLSKEGAVGGEALIRWQHKERGLISPFEFMPFVEESSLIFPVGNWVIEDALNKMARLNNINFKDLKISVNVSPRQFKSKDLIEAITSAIDKYNINHNNVVIEITEGHLMEHSELSSIILKKLKNLGVKIALDDFGTGYSSLSYLKNMPIDILKIDRAFIKDIDQSNESQLILNAIIKLAHGLNMEVVAEGVETKKQLDLLREKGCDIIQGFYFSKPLPFDEFSTYIKNKKII